MSKLLTLLVAVPVVGILTQPLPQQEDLEARAAAIVKRIQRGDRDSGRTELKALVEKSYAPLLEIYERTKNLYLKRYLANGMGLREIAAADIVIHGRVKKVRHYQGGVVDYHNLSLEFDVLKVLKGAEVAHEHMIGETELYVAYGTSQDWWLCDLMERDIESRPEISVWVFRERHMFYEMGSGTKIGFRFFEYRRLPADAIRAVEVAAEGLPK